MLNFCHAAFPELPFGSVRATFESAGSGMVKEQAEEEGLDKVKQPSGLSLETFSAWVG